MTEDKLIREIRIIRLEELRMRKKITINDIISYHPKGGIVLIRDQGMDSLIKEDKEKLNEILNEFFKTAEFIEIKRN